jgi:aspartate/glutamate racemase
VTHVPVLKPNAAMFEAALANGDAVGMLSNFAPSNALMEEEFTQLAARRNQKATLTTVTVPDALTVLHTGDVATHNRLLAATAIELSQCDVIVLAQFSASRAQAEVQSRTSVPVLAAPGAAVEKLQRLLSHS